MITKIFAERLNQKELGYITGLFLGDGYLIHEVKSRHFNVQFYLHSEKDLDVQENLINILRKTGANPRIKKDKRFKCNQILVSSRMFFEFITNLPFTISKSVEFKIGFVSGLIDSEGHVNSKKKFISVVNTESALITVLQNYLLELGISSERSIRKWANKNWSDTSVLYIPLKFLKTDNNSVKVSRLKMLQTAG